MRHAQTARPDVFHGAESDVGLSDLGLRQAQAVAPVFAGLGPAGVVSSGMLRARLTAQPITEACGLPLQVEPDLHERRVGSLSGTPSQTNAGVWPDTLKRWQAGETDYAPPGMESFDDIGRRVLPVFERLTAAYEGRSLLVVAHGIVIRVILLSVLEGWGPRDWAKLGRIANASVSELVRERGIWKPERLGEVPKGVPVPSVP